MAQKYYNEKETAQMLGVTEADVKQMLANHELHGYRDGADWKFKVGDIDTLADQRSAEASADDGSDDLAMDGDADVLMSEIELGESGPSTSGTVIGMEGDAQRPAADSDLQLATDSGQDDVGSQVAQFEDLDLSLDDDLTLEDAGDAATAPSTGSSAVDLSGEEMEDDDLVLGGSGTGSDITIGGDSGISLVDPTDSGLSLDEPLELGGSGTESLELGEDDLVSLGEPADEEAPTELKTDDDFLLTPLEEAGDDDDSESGSQVIALDTEDDEDDSATMIGDAAAAGVADESMATILEEDLTAEAEVDFGTGDTLGGPAQPNGFADGAPVAPVGTASSPEAPYSALNIIGLVMCVLLLTGCGMFMVDLLRNMWSWDGAYSATSSMMDTILGWFE